MEIVNFLKDMQILQERPEVFSTVLDNKDINVETELENCQISPIFAVYVGGQSSLIAGD